MNFLFWNLGQRPLADLVADACRENDVDVLLLAECTVSFEQLLAAFQERGLPYQLTDSANRRVIVFTRFPMSYALLKSTGEPDVHEASDHLPVCFKLDLG
jgi:hypothetical protein